MDLSCKILSNQHPLSPSLTIIPTQTFTIISHYWKEDINITYVNVIDSFLGYPLVRLKIENAIALFDKRWSRSNTYHERNLFLLLLPPFFFLSLLQGTPSVSKATANNFARWSNNNRHSNGIFLVVVDGEDDVGRFSAAVP